jgi:hypothetical protein
MVTGCAPQGAATVTWSNAATTFHNVKASNEWGNGDYDRYDEPYLMRVAFRVTTGVAGSAQAWLVSDYPNIICKTEDGTRPLTGTAVRGPKDCPISTRMGTVEFPNLQLPDVIQIAQGAPVEILGTFDVMYERDQLFPGGPIDLWKSVANVLKVVLNDTLAQGALPDSPEAIAALIGDVFSQAIGVVGGVVGSIIGGIGGAPDEIVSIAPSIYLAVGGNFAGLLRNVLPSVIGLVNTAISSQPNSPFPNGLPIQIGVVSAGTSHTTFANDKMTYTVDYMGTVR